MKQKAEKTKIKEEKSSITSSDPSFKDAPPPLHSVAIVCILSVGLLSALPTVESLDQEASLETFSTPQFSSGFLSFSPAALGWIRMMFAGCIFAISADAVLAIGRYEMTHYLPQSKLQPANIYLHGLKTQAPFTSWAWNLLGLSFFLSGLISLLVAHGWQNVVLRNPWLLRMALLSFEAAAPTSMLVAFIVKYVIWPQQLARKQNTKNLRKFPALLQHNANVVMALTEAELLGGLPVRAGDCTLAPLFGIAYVLFTWYMTNRWTRHAGPQFYYFFLDTTLGLTTSISLLALLAVLVAFHALFSMAHFILGHIGGGPVAHVAGIAIMASLLCRFRD